MGGQLLREHRGLSLAPGLASRSLGTAASPGAQLARSLPADAEAIRV